MLRSRILITDIGSTTTKSLLLVKENNTYLLKGMTNAATTVEKPDEDVKIGIYQSFRQLEKITDSTILSQDSDSLNMKIHDDITFLATSSAGGGLQILVIGLTLFDSASSAERAAYGAGGVLLDTLAVDDKRSALEQMQLMEFLHPDIILFSGGVDGGAISGVIRMAEILSISEPKPKYGNKNKIPLIFAGNVEAREFIESVLPGKFDVQMLPNVRPTMMTENIDPVSDKIHEIFLENVMEQAPGYASVKYLTSIPIIPTPSGVLNDMKLLDNKTGKNVMAVDIGGATTDVFSSILGFCYRTVSANYGLSYSIANVLKNCGMHNIKRWLPEKFSEVVIRNYIYSKMLFPTHIPSNDLELVIEQATAIEAIRMAKEQHLRMHFHIENLGFLDKLKNRDVDPFIEQMYAEKSLEKRSFHWGDIHTMIGSGGVISHAPTKEQAMAMMIFGLQPEGITELWRDKDFISPHLGILSKLDETLAYQLLINDCYEKLAIHVKPHTKANVARKTVLVLECKNPSSPFKKEFTGGMLELISNHEESLFVIHLQDGSYLDGMKRDFEIKTTLPLIIDTRLKKSEDSFEYLQYLANYKFTTDLVRSFVFTEKTHGNNIVTTGQQILVSSLPYPGEIMVHSSSNVHPETLLGQNNYGPPRIYVIQLLSLLGSEFTPTLFEAGLQVKLDEHVEVGQKIFKISTDGFLTGRSYSYHSNVRATVVNINAGSGSIILREIQDYSSKPCTINIATHLGIMPKYVKPYMKKHLGDFVNAGEVLAMDIKKGNVLKSNQTGTVTNMDWKEGNITIQYLYEPHILKANINGKVSKIEHDRQFTIEYEGTNITGIIGFGQEDGGILCISDASSMTGQCADKILVYNGKPSQANLEEFARKGISGLIVPCIDGNVLSDYIDGEIGVALTGNEKIPYPIIIMEGFGDFSFREDILRILKNNQGNYAYLRPKTQIRAGVIRPQIIIT